MDKPASSASGPLISIITPTYNCADYIQATVDSVRAQTYSNWEHIIIDDGSTDGTSALFQAYQDDPRIRYVDQGKVGQSYTRNHGLRLARGEFICFLDADDLFLPDKLEKSLAAFAQHPHIDVLYGDYINIDDQGRETSRHNMRRHSGDVLKPLLRDNFISFNTTMVRRRCFEEMGGQDENLHFAPDWDMWLRFATCYYFFYLPDYLTCYRKRPNQISANLDARFAANETILRNFFVRFPDRVTAREQREIWSFFYTRQGRNCVGRGKYHRAWRCYGNALVQAPWKSWAWRALAKFLLMRRG